jgi:hypothetical protein
MDPRVMSLGRNSNAPIQPLLNLVQEYEAAGWLNGKQAYEFTSLLQKNPELHDYVATQIQKIAAHARVAKPLAKHVAAPKEDPPANTKPASVDRNHQPLSTTSSAMGEPTKPKPRLHLSLETTTTTTTQPAAPLALEPAELSTVLSSDDDNHNGQTYQRLFAEMCFFARLGFVQPPSCLHCTYREGMEQQAPSLTCARWVVWRKNADVLLHPDKLTDNIMLFQCHAVRQLLQGKSVEGYQWDTKQKQLIVQQE